MDDGGVARTQALLDASPDLIWSVDKDLHLTACNAGARLAFAAIFRISPVLHALPEEMFPPGEASRWRDLYAQTMTQGRNRAPLTLSQDESIVVDLNPILVAGEVNGVAAFGADRGGSSERRETSREFQVPSGFVGGTFRTTPDGRLLAANLTTARMLGYQSSDEFLEGIQDVGRELWASPEARERMVRQLAATDEVLRQEALFRRKDGTQIWLAVSAYRLAHPDGDVFFEGFIEDIDVLKRAQAGFWESEERFRRIFDESGSVMLLIDAETGNIATANGAASRFYGYTRAELAKMNIRQINQITERELKEDSDRAKQVHRSQIPRRHRLASGQLRDVEVSVSTINVGGRSLFFSIIQDVTEQRMAEHQLRESEERFRSLFENNGSVMLLIDPESGRILDANAAAVAYYGYSRAEFARLKISEINVLATPQVYAEMKTAVTVRQREFQFRHRLKSGEIRDVEAHVSAIALHGKTALFSIVQDVTEKLKAERELRDSEERFRTTFEQAVIGMSHTTLDGVILRCNRRYAEILGYTVEEVVGKSFQDFTVEEDLEVGRIALERNRSGLSSGTSFEKRYRRKDGSIVWVMLYVSRQLDGDGKLTHMTTLTQDIHARKMAEARLSEAQAQLLQANKMEAIGLLAGGVAHDFNNIMGVILGYSEMLEKRLAADGPSLRYVKQIMAAQQKAQGLTRQLLAFSRKQVMHLDTLNVEEVVRDMTEMLQRLIGSNIELTVQADADLWRIRGDRAQLEQVLMNLVINARDAMPGGGLLSIQLANTPCGPGTNESCPTVRDGRWVKLMVSDTGEGMDEETRQRIFEPFFTTKAPGKGTGLGLSTTYGIVQQSGGCICVQSTVGKGTTFELCFPAVENLSRVALPSPEDRRGTAKKVLVVDDEEAIRNLVTTFLEAEGYEVAQASDPGVAMTLAHNSQPAFDLMVCDVVMPGMSGPAMVAQLKAEGLEPKVIFISGNTRDLLSRHQAVANGVTLLQKPFTSRTLLGAVRESLQTEMPQKA